MKKALLITLGVAAGIMLGVAGGCLMCSVCVMSPVIVSEVGLAAAEREAYEESGSELTFEEWQEERQAKAQAEHEKQLDRLHGRDRP